MIVITLGGIKESYYPFISHFFDTDTILNGDEINKNIIDTNQNPVVISSSLSEKERKAILTKHNLSIASNVFLFLNDAIKNENPSLYQLSSLFVPLKNNNIIDILQIPVALHCNLNCNRCYHFSSLTAKSEFYALNQFKEDLLKLSNLGIVVKEFRFLGGEPLLNPYLTEYIYFTIESFPYSKIKIITNGSLIPKYNSDALKTMANLGVIFSVSAYPPLMNRLNDITSQLNSIGAAFEIFRIGNSFDKILYENCNNHPVQTAQNCEKCVIIYNGNIGRCAPGMFISIFNSRFGVHYPENNTLKIDSFVSASYLIDFLDMHTPLCNYCTGDEVVETYEWSKTVGAPKLHDYQISSVKRV